MYVTQKDPVTHTTHPHASNCMFIHSINLSPAACGWAGAETACGLAEAPPVPTPQRPLAVHQPSPLSCPRDRRLESQRWEVGRSPPISVPQILLVKWGGLTRTGRGEGHMAHPRLPKDMLPCLSSEPQKSQRMTQ